MKQINLILVYILYSALLLQNTMAKDLDELHLTVIIPTYNNYQWYEKCLDSVRTQHYFNYDVIIIDDCSTDGQTHYIEKYIQHHNLQTHFKLIKNSVRRFKMANLYQAIHQCNDNDIIIILDGDDWLLDENVFDYFNSRYQCENIWITAGGYIEYPSGKSGFTRPIPRYIAQNNAFRQYPKTTSQLRTFYAWLFKQLTLEDLFFEGKFFKVASDVAKMYPMFELAGEHIGFNYRPVYVYNLANSINDHKISGALQTQCDKNILKRTPYNALKYPMQSRKKEYEHANAQIVLIVEDIDQMKNMVRCIKEKIQGFSEIIIITNNNNLSEKQYQSTPRELPATKQLDATSECFAERLVSLLCNEASPFVFFLSNHQALNFSIDLNKCIQLLAQTNAYGCYWKSAQEFFKNTDLFELLEDNIYAWQFSTSKTKSGRAAHALDLTLYKKESIVHILQKKALTDLQSVINALKKFELHNQAIGLCILTR